MTPAAANSRAATYRRPIRHGRAFDQHRGVVRGLQHQRVAAIMRIPHGVKFKNPQCCKHQQQTRDVARRVPAIVIVLVIASSGNPPSPRACWFRGPVPCGDRTRPPRFCTAGAPQRRKPGPLREFVSARPCRRREVENFAAPADKAVADRHGFRGRRIDRDRGVELRDAGASSVAPAGPSMVGTMSSIAAARGNYAADSEASCRRSRKPAITAPMKPGVPLPHSPLPIELPLQC